jgi:hypothetical protein
LLDVGLIFFEGLIYFLIGLLIGFLPTFSINYIFAISFTSKNELSKSRIISQTIFFGFLVSFLEFLSKLLIISYVDLINILMFYFLLSVTMMLLNVLFKIISRGDFSKKSFLKSANAGNYVGVIFFFGIFFFIFSIFFDFLISLIFLVLIVVIILISLALLARMILDQDYRENSVFNIFSNARAGISLFIMLLVIFSLSSYQVLFQANFVSPIQQATYFDGLITTSTEDLFHNEIPDNQVRLVNPDLADTLIRKHASVFGSNVIPLSIHITTRNGKLVWVGAMAPDNIFNQKLTGLLVLDASDPNSIPEKINLTDAFVSEGLFFDSQTQFVGWKSDQMQTYGRAYITWVPNGFSHPTLKPGDMVQVQTFYSPQLLAYQTRFGGVKIFDFKGTLLETYTDRLNMPSWVSQSMDENWLEENIANWGHLKSGTGFDIFAGGFLGITTPSSDRLEISQDTRYIISPDTNETVAVTPVHPTSNHLTNAGVFVSTANAITYFDYHQRGYLSSDAVEQYVESNEPQVAQGEYYATLPMLYPINVNDNPRLAWFIPVYHRIYTDSGDGEYYVTNVQFRGLYIYDSEKSNVYGRAYLSDFSSSSAMVKQAKENYRASYLGTTPTNTTAEEFITAAITQKSSFVQDGTTYIVFKTDNSTYQYLYASPKILSSKDWLTSLLDVEFGSNIKFKVYKSIDIWYLSSIEKI